MLVQTYQKLMTLVAAVSMLTLLGCSESAFESHFEASTYTQSLMKEAQNGVGDLPGVSDLVLTRFGTPQNLVAWKKLPIDFGGITGRITAVPDSAAVKEITVELDDDATLEFDPENPPELQFLTGEAAPLTMFMASWSAEDGVVGFTNALEAAPVVGDVVVLNGGKPLAHGRVLYMQHCSHCHGTSGNGEGPTAEYLNPRPRNYQHGVFKFTTTTAQAKVSREDLRRVLRNGVPGTYMPSFVPMLSEETGELDEVVEYVRFLTMRGEFERRMVTELSADFSKDALASRKEQGESHSDIVTELKDFLSEDLPDSLEFVSDDMEQAWTEANTEDVQVTPTVARIPDSVESRRRGRELFLSAAINCADCHGIGGQGNGPQTLIYEKNPVTQELYEEPGLHDIWDNVNQPRNLTRGIYRGGRRPYDLFCRIQAGIKGTRMPSYKNLQHEDIWHIVNYVLSIPFEPEPGHIPVSAASEAAPTATP